MLMSMFLGAIFCTTAPLIPISSSEDVPESDLTREVVATRRSISMLVVVLAARIMGPPYSIDTFLSRHFRALHIHIVHVIPILCT
jgi:hypothetical protein